MKRQQLNDELTIVGLVLILAFILYELYNYSNRILEAQKAVIYLDYKLTKAEVQSSNIEQQLIQTQSQLIQLSNNLEDYQHLDRLKKDIDRNLWPDKQ